MKRMATDGSSIGRLWGAGLAGLAVLALAAVWMTPVLRAEDAGKGARAARLSYVDGKVRIAQGGQVLADQAVANTPLFEGSQVATADDGQAEIQFDDGSVARLSPNSTLTLKVLRGQGAAADAEIVEEGGLGYFELQGGSQSGQMRLRFGDSVATASGFTVLRVKMDAPPGELAVFSGNAHLERGTALTLDLHGGESVALHAGDAGRYDLAESIEPDSWDSWNSDRDQALTAEATAQTGAANDIESGNSQNPAWSDLDASGNWYNVPGQGYVWSPYEAASAGFDPYGYGNWIWTPGYGYIWASGYPWGYLPFQCGAWNFYNDFGWGWLPGMGGCQPWWGMGFYGGLNIGYGPPGYRPIRRPIGRRQPGGPIGHPVIAVNRRPSVVTPGLPARDRNTPVTIAGNTVQALRPIAPRQSYARPAFGFQPHPQSGSTGASGQPNAVRPGYRDGRTGYAVAPRSAGSQGPPPPSHVTGTPSRTYTPPPSRGSSGGAAQPSHPSGGGASHNSGGGGGGGGGSHSSGGGGGGGGGGGSHGGGGGHR
jgi:hypothetical protein